MKTRFLQFCIVALGLLLSGVFSADAKPELDAYGRCNLPLDNLSLLTGATYDGKTHTISFTKEWQFAGWQYAEDLSGFERLVVTFSKPVPTPMQLGLKFADENANVVIDVVQGALFVELPLTSAHKKSVTKEIIFGNYYAGDVVLKEAFFEGRNGSGRRYLNIDGVQSLDWTNSTYDASARVVNFNDGWACCVWKDLGDLSAYQKMAISFAKPISEEVVLSVRYADESSSFGKAKAGATGVEALFDPNKKVEMVWLTTDKKCVVYLNRFYVEGKSTTGAKDLSLDFVDTQWGGISYDPSGKVIKFENAWSTAGWKNLFDIADYSRVVIEYESDINFMFRLFYGGYPENQQWVGHTCSKDENRFEMWFDESRPKGDISGIYAVSTDALGSVKLKRVYLLTADGEISTANEVVNVEQKHGVLIQGMTLQAVDTSARLMELYDMSGRLCAKAQGNTLSLSALNKGIYVVRVVTANGVASYKIKW